MIIRMMWEMIIRTIAFARKHPFEHLHIFSVLFELSNVWSNNIRYNQVPTVSDIYQDVAEWKTVWLKLSMEMESRWNLHAFTRKINKLRFVNNRHCLIPWQSSYICARGYIHARIHMYVCIYTCICMYVCMYIHIY